MRKILVLTMLSLFMVSFVFAAQNEEISHNKTYTETKDKKFSDTSGNSHYVIDCSGWGFFSDRRGNHKPYMNESDYYTTICSNTSSKGVTVTFQQFALEKFDYLHVWDESRSGPVTEDDTPEKLNTGASNDGVDYLGKHTRRTSPGTITSKRGCLTFRFISDKDVNDTGWYAKIGCANKPSSGGCNLKIEADLKCGVVTKGDNYSGTNKHEYYGDCTMPGWPASGRELIYKFVNHKASDLHFKLKEANGDQPKVLNMFILNDCDPDACIGSINRPADNGHQNRDYVHIKNAPAGTYYIVVDGNKPYAHNWFELTVECAGGDYYTCKDPYYYEDFEYFYPGDYITTYSHHWYKSHNVGIRDARVSDDRHAPGNGYNSLEFNRKDEGTQDVFMDLGRKFKGVYRICWNMYIEPHHTAFFGLFGGDNSDPWGTVSKEFGHNNGYEGRWFDVELFVDLDKNKYTLYLDNRCKKYSGDYTLNLDKLNFYGLPKAHFYVDHICYGPVSKIPSTRIASSALEDTPLFNSDRKKTFAGTVPVATTDDNNTNISLTTSKFTAEDLKVMPNPTTGVTMIALDLAQTENVNLQLFSSAGQLVKDIPLGATNAVRQEVDLSGLANGLYIIKATSEQTVITKKIILQQ